MEVKPIDGNVVLAAGHIGDRGPEIAGAVEQERVGPGPAGQGIIAFTALQHIIASTTIERVIAGTTAQMVGTVVAKGCVIALVTVKSIRPGAQKGKVGPVAAIHVPLFHIGDHRAEIVGGRGAGHGENQGRCTGDHQHGVDAGAAVDGVDRTRIISQQVATAKAAEYVGPQAAKDHVVIRPASNGVVAAAGVDDQPFKAGQREACRGTESPGIGAVDVNVHRTNRREKGIPAEVQRVKALAAMRLAARVGIDRDNVVAGPRPSVVGINGERVASGDRVVASPAILPIFPDTAAEVIIALAAKKRILAGSGDQPVIARTAKQVVSAVHAIHRVVAAQPMHKVVVVVAEQKVVAGGAV